MALGLSLLFRLVRLSLVVVGFSRSNISLMDQLSGIKRGLWQKVSLNWRGLIIRILSLQQPRSSLFVVYWLWLLPVAGLFINSTLIMLFSIVTSTKKFTCLHRQGFGDRGRNTCFVVSTSHYMG
jgi:hypothetical protein